MKFFLPFQLSDYTTEVNVFTYFLKNAAIKRNSEEYDTANIYRAALIKHSLLFSFGHISFLN